MSPLGFRLLAWCEEPPTLISGGRAAQTTCRTQAPAGACRTVRGRQASGGWRRTFSSPADGPPKQPIGLSRQRVRAAPYGAMGQRWPAPHIVVLIVGVVPSA